MTKQHASLLSPFTLAAAATLALSASPRAGHAFEPDSHPCFQTAPRWNATNGELVAGISPGPVSAIFTALNQSRTHVMLANVVGGDYWATESTTRKPSIHQVPLKTCVLGICVKVADIPDPSMPIEPKELAQGSPGFSQINMGGAYAYWQSATQVFRERLRISAAPSCKDACKANAAANYLWNDVPYDVLTSAADPSAFFYSLKSTDSSGTTAHISYGVHQFMDGVARVTDGATGESPGLRGIACSQVPAWGYRNWVLSAQPDDIASGTGQISTHQYSKSITNDAGRGLWDSVYDGCMTTNGGFWAGYLNFFSSLLGPTVQEQTCTAAAFQVLNCFVRGENSNGSGCTSSDPKLWRDYRLGSAGGANSMSPDDIMGLSGSANAGPWATGTQVALQWNGGGSTYGCFY